MKKIISLGIASAVLALTAISASAEIAPVLVGSPVEGSTYTVTIVADEEIKEFQFDVVATGAEVADLDKDVFIIGGYTMKSLTVDGDVSLVGSAGTGTFAAGTEIATITYTVTGAAGEDFSVKLVSDFGGVNTEAFTATIEEGDGTQTPGQSGTGTQTPGDKDNPETGIALAVVPAVLAGAAVVVAKKRK